MCKQVKVAHKRRLSLVRFLASLVPNILWKYFLPGAPKTIINVDRAEKSPFNFQNNLKLLCSCQLSKSRSKSDSENENTSILALQNELQEVKKQIAQLMKQQTEHIKYPDDKVFQNLNQSQRPNIPVPPPFPNISVTPNTPPKIESKKKLLIPQHGFPCGKELLRDIQKVQLKKVEKSPGGGPLKKPRETINSSRNILDATVKERLELFENSPGCDVETNQKLIKMIVSVYSETNLDTPEKFYKNVAN